MLLEKLNQLIKNFLLILIRFYQKWLSLDHGIFSHEGIRVCRFHPTCSEYMYQSIQKFGIVKGGLKGTYRILRCNPFNKGGYDPVK